MATKKPKRASLSPFFVTSTFTLDVEVTPEFAQNLTITQVSSRTGNTIYRLVADPKGGKVCVNLPPKIGETPSDDCADRGISMIIDGATPDPWRIRLGRSSHPKRGK
jgi:hypothetical protein